VVDNATASASDWLGAKLRATRAYIVRLVGRIDDLTVTKATAWDGGPDHAKLAAWLAEVADLKREEGATLARIEAAEAKARDKRRERRRAVLTAPAARKPPASSLWFWLILLFVLCEEAGDKIAATVGTAPKAKPLTPEL
jgi:hypothetical protein